VPIDGPPAHVPPVGERIARSRRPAPARIAPGLPRFLPASRVKRLFEAGLSARRVWQLDLEKVADAHRKIEQGGMKNKIVITID
jgi:hypothetical protein